MCNQKRSLFDDGILIIYGYSKEQGSVTLWMRILERVTKVGEFSSYLKAILYARMIGAQLEHDDYVRICKYFADYFERGDYESSPFEV